MTVSKGQYNYGRGRRKEASARVRLYFSEGKSVINGKEVDEYCANNKLLIYSLNEPLRLTGNEGKVYFSVKIVGGGTNGQIDAIKLGLARALVVHDDNNRLTLRKAGLLTRDPREKERKKYGLKRARKAPQFSKR